MIDLVALLAEVTSPEYLASPEHAAIEAARAEREAREAKEAAKAQARIDHPCGRCRGTGHLPEFRHVAGGDCFACEGTGIAGFARLP